MKKHVKTIIFLLIFTLIFSFAACEKKGDAEENDLQQSSGEQNETPQQSSGEQNETPQQSSGEQNETPEHTHSYGEAVTTKDATYNTAGETTATCSCGATKTETIPSLIPTASTIADGIATVKNEPTQSYDFGIKAEGNVSLAGFSGNADANYEGKYRYDSGSDDLKFYRRTSGKLLMNADEYICNKGNSRLKVKTNTSGLVKKVSVAPRSDDELNMLNLPFISLIYALKADNLNAVTKNTSDSEYKFKTSIKISTDFSPVEKLLSIVEKLGENITIKNVTFTNPQNGIELFFNVTDAGVLSNFKYEFDVSFPVSSMNATLKVIYTQKASSTAITLPNISSFISDESDITSAVGTLASAVNAVKNADAYSLDLTAVNNFDAGWNRSAIIDKYTGRMYKNTNDGRIDFNHSYKYKAHTEEDGAEGFAYTVGNIQDGTVYEIGRKGKNTQIELDGETIDSRFAIMTGLTALSATDVDFISQKNNADGSVTYTFYTNDTATHSLQQTIADLINSNTGVGVVPVENYFNDEDYKIVSADFSATMKNGKLVSFIADIEIKYVPTGGAYTDSKVTLKNSVALTVNENLESASKYSSPKSVTTKLGSFGLNNAKYYIL